MAPKGKGQGRWTKSKTIKPLGGKLAREAAEAAAAAKAELDAAAKLAEAQEKKAKATPRPDSVGDPSYRNDRQDLP